MCVVLRIFPAARAATEGNPKSGKAKTTATTKSTAIPVRILPSASAIPILHSGGIIAYPTEAVWGLGCDPANQQAVLKLLALKQRPIEKGLILVAAYVTQLTGWAELDALPDSRRQAVLATWPGPQTWVLPAGERAPRWITGAHSGIAVRVSAHPPVQELCRAFAAPLVSTSANYAGEPPVRCREQLDQRLISQLDGILDGETGGLEHATAIYDARSGQRLR